MEVWLKERGFNNGSASQQPLPDERLVWRILTKPMNGINPDNASGPAHRALKIRVRLTKITRRWEAAAEDSKALRNSILAVLNTLLSDEKEFSWSLPVHLNDSSIETVSLKASKTESSHWTVDANEISALLSLWLFHIREKWDVYTRDIFIEAHGIEQIRSANRLLGPASADFKRNVSFWIGSENDQGLMTMSRDHLFYRLSYSDYVRLEIGPIGFGPIGFCPDWDINGAHASKCPVHKSKTYCN